MKIIPDKYAIELLDAGIYYKRGASEFPAARSAPVLVNNLFSAHQFDSRGDAERMCGIIERYTQRDFRIIIVPFYARR